MVLSYDIVVGIPSYNEADSIGYVAQQIDKGLLKYFPDKKAIIVNVDNNSPDNTKGAFLGTETKTEKKYITTPPGIKGKGNNFYNLFKFIQNTDAKAIVVVDADLKSITPEWVGKFCTSVFNGSDYVTPLYLRHKYDGTITNMIVFPLVYSLFGKFVRQPIGGDFAFSKKFADYCLEREWSETTRQYGIDIFLTLNAIVGGFKISQVELGAKIHKPSAPKLGPMFVQVVNTLFDTIIKNIDIIKQNSGEEIRAEEKQRQEPPHLDVDVFSMHKNCVEEFEHSKEILKKIIPEALFSTLEKIFSEESPVLSKELWAEVVFEMLARYSTYSNKKALIESLKPVYFLRTYSFIKQTFKLTSNEAEKLIIEQAEEFKRKKGIFLEKGINQQHTSNIPLI